MKLASPAVQWYFKQWLGDQKVLGMDWDANGMHFWLINLSFQEDPPGTIPNDVALIRRWLRLSPNASWRCQRSDLVGSTNDASAGCSCPDCVWRRVRPQIFSAWTLIGERWHQNGAIETAEKQLAYSKSRSKAAKSRWEHAHALHTQYENDALQSSSSSSSSKKKQEPPPLPPRGISVPVVPLPVLPPWVAKESWEGFVEMRKKIRAPLTGRAVKGIVDKLSDLRANGQDPNACLDQSTERAWRGVFEVHVNRGNSNGANSNGHSTKANRTLNAARELIAEYSRGSTGEDGDAEGSGGVERDAGPVFEGTPELRRH